MSPAPETAFGVPGCTSSSTASLALISAALKLASTVFGRWMDQMLSCASTEMPIVEPVTQWFGSGLGQNGSTSKYGACLACASAAGVLNRTTRPITKKKTTDKPISLARLFIAILPTISRQIAGSNCARLLQLVQVLVIRSRLWIETPPLTIEGGCHGSQD